MYKSSNHDAKCNHLKVLFNLSRFQDLIHPAHDYNFRVSIIFGR